MRKFQGGEWEIREIRERECESLKCGTNLNNKIIPDNISGRKYDKKTESSIISGVIHAIGQYLYEHMCLQVKEQRPAAENQPVVPSRNLESNFDSAWICGRVYAPYLQKVMFRYTPGY